MKDEAQAVHLIRFEAFEVNLRSGELRKNGSKVKLPEQSFQILAMLLERPGEVVLRPEIQKRLWPNDTVVEFENSINAEGVPETVGGERRSRSFYATFSWAAA